MEHNQSLRDTRIPVSPGHVDRIHRWIISILVLIMSGELALILWNRQWLTGFLILAIIAVALVPLIFKGRFWVRVPPEFHLLAIIFIFASLFLGEVRNFYERVWWWDIALHTFSGLLLGVFGFLMVYVLNEIKHIELHMRPRFVALFAFLFAVAIGTVWEIFEFGMDQLFGMQMQKPMLGDPSGLTDTMWDLIVDALGALVISVLGWWYMWRRETSFIEVWIQKFIAGNPQLFRSNMQERDR